MKNGFTVDAKHEGEGWYSLRNSTNPIASDSAFPGGKVYFPQILSDRVKLAFRLEKNVAVLVDYKEF